ncbi:hypothetical protein R6Q59_033381 [Mikania micrantha]
MDFLMIRKWVVAATVHRHLVEQEMGRLMMFHGLLVKLFKRISVILLCQFKGNGESLTGSAIICDVESLYQVQLFRGWRPVKRAIALLRKGSSDAYWRGAYATMLR